jgi:hypothetical protein
MTECRSFSTTWSLLQNRAGNLLLGEPLDGAGNLGSGSVGDMRQLRELPRISGVPGMFGSLEVKVLCPGLVGQRASEAQGR